MSRLFLGGCVINMTRLIALLLIFSAVLPLTIPCSAEETFSLHHAIAFGDTKAEVKMKEEGMQIESNVSFLLFDSCAAHQNNNLRVTGEVAGFADAHIQFDFDEKDTLASATYFLTWGNIPESCTEDYDKINKALTDKYSLSDDQAKELIEKHYIHSCIYDTLEQFEDENCEYYVARSDAYTYQQQDGNVVVIYAYILQNSILGTVAAEAFCIEYHLYPADEYTKGLEAMDADGKKQLDDL